MRKRGSEIDVKRATLNMNRRESFDCQRGDQKQGSERIGVVTKLGIKKNSKKKGNKQEGWDYSCARRAVGCSAVR